MTLELKKLREAIRSAVKAHSELSFAASRGQDINDQADTMEDCAHKVSIAIDALQMKLKNIVIH